ncbi:nucleolin [Salix koriyanagi]|uniref:Nucleolin n=1 Tax=Salix koriyanagi TaxID=2511006 RepID=A0A9Q0W8J1_9ROSI|nr:nucleolin [Salix koriyanagi]
MEWDEMMNNRSKENNRCGSVSWILNKGLLVGKMILIAGFLISSAAVILPSFVVVSAIWFACSVPYGLFLASYAFTCQLMSKILPASSLEFYGTNKNIFVDDYREDDARADQFGGDIIDMEKEGGPELFLKNKNNATLVEENGFEEGVEDRKPPSKTQQAEEEDEEQVIERVSAILMEKEPIQDVRSGDKELVVSPPNEDAREIADESGLDLFDDRLAGGPQCSYTDYRNPEGSEQSSYKAYEVTLPTTVDGSKCTGITPENGIHLAAGDAKVLYSEEKIWKQIRAIRTILGYKASVRGTCIEELKALYVFTGVEPPDSFRDPSDLAELNDKVKFLMTIVGVK